MTFAGFKTDTKCQVKPARVTRKEHMSYPQYLPNITATLAKDIDDEISRSNKHEVSFASLHEAYAVILEELDEFWDITKQKKKKRNAQELRQELIQVAAMAIKAINSLPNFVGGEV
jgi:NTP pyrophosphatase (non-canonical NTP hydrolase)